MASIILRLLGDTRNETPFPAGNVEYVVLGEQNKPTKPGPVDEAIAAAKDKTVFLMVPGQHVISVQKSLPKMPMGKLVKALPYTIEDTLLEPVELYHLVISHLEPDGQVNLLVTLHQNVAEWLASFHNQLVFEAMLPDYFLLPYEPSVWHIALEKNVLIRTGLYQGYACDRENWQQFLILLWQGSPESSHPTRLVIHTSDHQQQLDTSQLNVIPVSIEQKKQSGNLLNQMAATFEQNRPPCNLLQGRFEQEHHLSTIKKTVLIALIVLAAALCFSLISTLIQLIVLKRQDSFLQTQITAIYKQVYPASTSVVAPQVRMEGTLKELQVNQAGSGYLGVLALTGKVLRQLPAIKIISLQYQNNQLMLELQANSFKSLDLALDQLNRNNLIAKQDQGATRNNQVVARFTIEEKH